MLKEESRRIIVRMREETAIENALPASPAGFGETPYKCTRLYSADGTTNEPYEIPQNVQERIVSTRSMDYAPAYDQMSKEEKCLFRTYSVEAPSGADLDLLLQDMNGNDEVEFAQIDELNELALIPNDESFDRLWGLQKIQCDLAWDATQGEDVIVAVLDTGVDYNHPDIKDNMWVSSDGKFGFDFSDNDDNPMDYHSHGTHVAGTISAVGNNNIGVIGVAPKAKIMAIKIFPRAYDSVIARALRWAVDNGAKVLNNSWGPTRRRPNNPVIEDAINYVNSKGGICVFAAGNSNDDTTFYSPANLSSVITVGATDSNDSRASFSNWGVPVDVSAPGVGILSLQFKTSNYVRKNGTSMACPHVAGLAALYLQKKPNATRQEVQQAIEKGADLIDTDRFLGKGRINAAGTVHKFGFEMQTGTALHETGDNFDFTAAPNGDIVAIKKRRTGTNSTEVHILSAASNYRAFSLHTGTALHETGNNFAFAMADNRDLFVIKKSRTGSNSTEVHILSASNNYRSFSLHTGTALHETGNDFDFVVAPNRDLIAIKKSQTGSNSTEIHILSAVSNYQSFTKHTGTALHETGDDFEFAVAPNRDIIAIKKNNTGSDSTEIHILSASSNYQKFSLHTGTALPETNNRYCFAFSANGELFSIKKNDTATNSTEVSILKLERYVPASAAEAILA